jgi:hypothetical protein
MSLRAHCSAAHLIFFEGEEIDALTHRIGVILAISLTIIADWLD